MIKRSLLEKFLGLITLGQRFVKNADKKTKDPRIDLLGSYRIKAALTGSPSAALKQPHLDLFTHYKHLLFNRTFSCHG